MKLVIIGNGFDLGSGLPTAYRDFFNYRSKEVKSAFEKIDEILDLKIKSIAKKQYELFLESNESVTIKPKQVVVSTRELLEKDILNALEAFESKVRELDDFDVSFWDIYFWVLSTHNNNSKNYNWFEIENEVSNFLSQKSGVKYLTITELNASCKNIFRLNAPDFDKDIQINDDYFKDVLYDVRRDTKMCALLSCFLSHKKINEETDFHDILLSQLVKFEEAFRKYIVFIMNIYVTSNRKNQSIYRDNFLNIIENGTDFDFFILNFNYTSIATKRSQKYETSKTDGNLVILRREKKFEIVENNVHGNFESISIFGIDQNDVKASSPTYIFTKTYRKIESQSLLKKISLPAKEEINEIIFFGHSLSKADYSYFQSIFDLYDIYNSRIKLSFKYALYGPKKNHRHIKNNQIKSVTKLVKSYGDTMSNPNHGNNLIHKLILENRISLDVVELEKLYKENFIGKNNRNY